MRRAKHLAVGALALLSACSGLSVSKPDELREPSPEARAGGRIVVGITAPESIDPAFVSDDSGRLVASLVCEPLVQLDAATGKLSRGMANAVTVTAKGAAVTIGLRKGVKFHDGSTVESKDVHYALSRVSRHDVASPNAEVLSGIAGWTGIHAPTAPTDDTEPKERRLAGVAAVNRHAVVIGLENRNAEYVRALATPMAAPVPEEMPDRNPSFGEQPVCAGPYRVAKPYRKGDTVIELRRFEDYYGRSEAFVGGGRGYADVIEFRILPDRAAQVREFEAGNVDVALVPHDQVGPTRAKHVDSFMTAATPQVDFIGFPDDVPVETRRMLAMSIDRQRLVDEVFGGGRIPARGWLPENTGLSGEPCPATGGSRDVREPLTLTVNDDFSNRALAEAVVRQWREDNIAVELEVLPWDKFLTKATATTGFDGMFRASWAPAYAGPDGFMGPLFHSGAIGTSNLGRFSDRDFDRRLDRVARQEAVEDVRLAKYEALFDRLCEELPVIPLTFGQEEYLVRRDRIGTASGTWFERSTGLPALREWYVR